MMKNFLLILLCFFAFTFYQCSSTPGQNNTQSSAGDSPTTDSLTTQELQTYNQITKEISELLQSINVNTTLKMRSELFYKNIKGTTKNIDNLTNIFTGSLATNVNGADGSLFVISGQSDFADNLSDISYMETKIMLGTSFSQFKQLISSSKLNGIYNENNIIKKYFQTVDSTKQVTNVTYTTKSIAELSIDDRNLKWDINISIIIQNNHNTGTNIISYSESGKINDKTYTYVTNIITSSSN